MPTRSARLDDDRERQEADQAGRPVTAWRQPVVWLGAVIFLASLIGCIVTIVLASRHDDPMAGAGADYLMKVPLNRLPVDPAPAPAPAPR